MNPSFYSSKWKDEDQPEHKEAQVADWEQEEEPSKLANPVTLAALPQNLPETHDISPIDRDETLWERKKRERALIEKSDIALLEELFDPQDPKKESEKQ